MVKRALETIIQQRFQPLEAELRSGLSVKDIIHATLSKLFKNWQGGTLAKWITKSNPASSQAYFEEGVPKMTEDEMNNFAQPLPAPQESLAMADN